MIAAISLMRRQDTVTQGAFRRHWLDVHGPLVCAFPGLRAYAQCHPIESPAMNAAARAMRIDGFPILYFANDEDRLTAHGSPEMAACNSDSRLFVGAVSRVVTDVDTMASSESSMARVSLLTLFPPHHTETILQTHLARLGALPGLCALARYHVREQGAAPASTIPHLPIATGAATQARFASIVDLECAVEDWTETDGARFVVEEHWLV